MYPWNNLCNTRLNAEFRFSRMNQALPFAIMNADENAEFNRNTSMTQIESRELVAKSIVQRTRQRTSTTVGMADKDFELSEIFDIYDSTVLDEFLASFAADQYNVRHLFERRTGWRIEKRKRTKGRFERFFHHKKSKKTFRSLSMVKIFIKNINSLPQRARPRQKNTMVGRSQRATMKRKRNEDSTSDMMRARECEMINDFELLWSKRKFMDYFRFS